nr:hypothetical protein [Tanacetum cinerariifolium]
MEGCSQDAKSRYNTRLAQLLPRHIYSPCFVNVLNKIGCDGEIDDMLRIKLREAGSNEEIITFVAWIRAFNIIEPIYAELCHEFYTTYEFDEEVELDEEGFNVYFERGLRIDEHFNTKEYWLSISREDNLGLSRSHTSSIKSLILRVIYMMITYGLCQRMNGDLDMTTLMDLIDSEGRLIPEDPQPCVPRVGVPRPPRASMQDLYRGAFEHMVGVYNVPLQRAYNPLGYAQPHNDQYYQQYPPPHQSSSNNMMMMSSVEMTQVCYVTMSRDVLTVGSTLRIHLLYRGEYSQWSERFMNYLEEQTDGEVMINSIKNGGQSLPRVTQVSIAGTSSTEQPPLKDKSMWSDQEKKIQKIDRLARSLLIQGEQDRKAVVLYEYKTFKATEGELFLDTYIRYLQMINDLKKCGFLKDSCELNFKFLNNLQPKWKKYSTMMRKNKNLMDINIDALYNIFKQNQGYVNDAMGLKKKTVVITSDPLALIAKKTKVSKRKEKIVVSSDSKGSDEDDFSELKKITALLETAFNRMKFYSTPTNNNLRTSSASISANKKQEYVKSNDKKEEKKVEEKKRDMCKVKCYNCKKEGHFTKDCKKAKVKDYDYYKTKILLAKKDKDEQVLLAEDHAWMESSRDSDQQINATMKRLEKVNLQSKDFENQNKVLQEKCDVLQNQATSFEEKNNELNEQIKVLIEKNDDLLAQTNVLQEQLKVKHVVIDTHVECQVKYAKLKMSRQLVKMDENVRMLKNKVLEKDLKISQLEECVCNKDLEIEICLERLNESENKLHKISETNQTIHMIMPSKDKFFNGKKGIGFEKPSYFYKAKDLRPTLYDERVISLWYTSRFLTHFDKALETEKFKRARENKIKFAYDYGNLNASYVNEKINLLDDYFQEIINPDFDKIDSPFQQTSSLKPYVPTVILELIIIDLEIEVVSLLAKEKANLETIESLKSKGFESSEKEISESKNQSKNDCQVVENVCDDLENPNVIAPRMFKLSVSQSDSPVSVSKTPCASNKVETKRKRKRRTRNSSKETDKQVNNDLRANRDFVHLSYLDTLSSVRRPKPSGVMWKKKGSSNTVKADLSSVNHSNLNKNVKRYNRKDLLSCNNSHLVDTKSEYDCNAAMHADCNSYDVDVNDLFDFDDVNIRKSQVSKMPFRKKQSAYLNMPFGNNSKKSLSRNVLSGFLNFNRCSKHMTGNHSFLTNIVEKFLRTIRFGNNDFGVIAGYGDVVIGSMTIMRVYYVEGLGLPKMKFKKDHLCSACEQGKIHRKHHKSKMAFVSNQPLYLLHMDLCGSMRVDSINGKRHVLVVVDDFSRCYLLNDYDNVGKLKAKWDIGVFVGYSKDSAAFRVYNKRTRKIYESVNVNFDEISEMASKQFSLESGLTNLNVKGKSSNPIVLQVEETSKKDLEDLFHNFYDEYFDASKLKKSLTTNVETSNNKGEVFHEVFESFQGESSSSSSNDDVQQTSSSHNVFNEQLEDAYFDASIAFHDTSDVHTYYQTYPHETKWTKDHPLHKIIGDPKSSVRTRGQLANSCLFACLLSCIEPANVAKALKDADWVIAMQDEFNQFARLKVWRLVPKLKGKTVIKTKWILKNKKDESSLVIRNKERLVAVGYSQQEGIDYDETFASVA